MRIFDCSEAGGRGITRYGSEGATYAGLVSIRGEAALGVIRLAAPGRLGRHVAPMRQLMVVIAGSGQVSGADGNPVDVASGTGVLWEGGEDHETSTAGGMTVLILEADQLELTEPAADG